MNSDHAFQSYRYDVALSKPHLDMNTGILPSSKCSAKELQYTMLQHKAIVIAISLFHRCLAVTALSPVSSLSRRTRKNSVSSVLAANNEKNVVHTFQQAAALVETELTRLESIVAQKEAEIAAANEAFARQQADWSATVDALQQETNTLQSDKKELQLLLEKERSARSATEQELHTTTELAEELKGDVDGYREQLKTAQSELADLQSRLQQQDETNKILQQALRNVENKDALSVSTNEEGAQAADALAKGKESTRSSQKAREVEAKRQAARVALEAKRVEMEAKRKAAQEAATQKKAALEAKRKAAQEAEMEAKQKAAEEKAAKQAKTVAASRKVATSASKQQSGVQTTAAGIPRLNDWQINARGEVTAEVMGHPTINDGEIIVTSPLSNPRAVAEKKIVVTASGSKYQLENRRKEEFVSFKEDELELTGETAGESGKYLVAGKSKKSTNGRSMLYTVYRSDEKGEAKGQALALKVSFNKEAMERERSNYQKVMGGFLNFKRGVFVVQREFLPEAGGSLGTKQSALVMEKGTEDLKQYVREHGPMKGRTLRNAAASVVQCIEALHNVRLVWTDLKTENFVVVEAKGSVPMTVKGIDLESAIPVRGNPVDYSPEACPPEFAVEHLEGDPSEFVLDYSYDIWSFGMLLFELNMGHGYFDDISTDQSAIMKLLPDLEPSVEDITDENMADLILQCLSRDPSQRPTVAQILLHPYFLTTGVGPFSF